MKHTIIFGSILASFCFLSSCNENSSLVYDGCKLTSKPELPVAEAPEQGFFIDAINNQIPSCKILDISHSDTVTINGWTVDTEGNNELNKLIIQIGSKFVEGNYGIERSDVQSTLGFQSNKIGFSFSFSKSLLQEENGFIVDHFDFIRITNGGKQLTPITYKLLKEPTIPELPVQEKNYAVAGGGFYLDSYFNPALNAIVLTDVINSPIIIISGWAFDSEKLDRLSNIYLKFGDHTIEGSITERTDVQNTFNVKDSMIGFVFEVPSYLMKTATGEMIKEIEIIGINYTNEYKFTPATYNVIY